MTTVAEFRATYESVHDKTVAEGAVSEEMFECTFAELDDAHKMEVMLEIIRRDELGRQDGLDWRNHDAHCDWCHIPHEE